MNPARFIHITLNCNHAVSLAKTLNKLSKWNEHEILIYDKRAHKKDYIKEIKERFINTKTLENNVRFNDNNIIIFHGLFLKFSLDLFRQVISMPLKKIWIIWGGDVTLLKNEDNINVLNKLDYVICAPGELLPYKKFTVPQVHLNLNLTSEKTNKKNQKTNMIVLGNSGDPSNEHEYLLEIAKNFRNADIYIPFAYNTPEGYLQKLIKKTYELKIFDRVEFQTNIISFEEYKNVFENSKAYLSAHNRQQSFGTIQIAYTSNCETYLRKTLTLETGEKVVNPTYLNCLIHGYANIKDIVDLENSKQTLELPLNIINNINELSIANIDYIENTFEILKK